MALIMQEVGFFVWSVKKKEQLQFMSFPKLSHAGWVQMGQCHVETICQPALNSEAPL